MALTTNQNYVRDFTVAYDILYENISDQVSCLRLPACLQFLVELARLTGFTLLVQMYLCLKPQGGAAAVTWVCSALL